MKTSTILAGALVPAAISLSVAVAFAHGGATGIVKERMEAMEAMGKAVKKTAAMLRGEAAYDAAIVRETATIIKAHSGAALTKLFPKGTGGGASEARADIWTDWETFKALASRLGVLGDGLLKAADNGPGAAMPGASMMGTGGMMGASPMMGSGPMMNSGPMMGSGDMPSADMLAQMPASGVFTMVVQTCSSCHTQFRLEKK